MMRERPDISIELNMDTFSAPDMQELEERLRSETDLRVESSIFGAATLPGEPLPPDVVIYLLYAIAPLVTNVVVNVLSSALWDAIKAAFERERREASEATFSIVTRDEKGQILRTVSGRISDPESIKALIREALEDDEE